MSDQHCITSMVVLVVHDFGITFNKSERDTPVSNCSD
jgi:hypothetical protein